MATKPQWLLNLPAQRQRHVAAMQRCLPAGAVAEYERLTWHKRGGHAGSKQIHKALEKLKAMGFRPHTSADRSVPDGSVMGTENVYVNDTGDSVHITQSYGVTSTDNSFYMSIVLSIPKA
jgi:hypothetical protein